MNIVDLAREFRKEFEAQRTATQKLLRADTISDEELLELIDVFDEWKVGEKLNSGDKRRYSGKLYKVNDGQGHTTQANWSPDVAVSLFTEIVPDAVIREIPEVITPEQKFSLGERGTWKGKIYESLLEANVWTPDAHPSGWKLIE